MFCEDQSGLFQHPNIFLCIVLWDGGLPPLDIFHFLWTRMAVNCLKGRGTYSFKVFKRTESCQKHCWTSRPTVDLDSAVSDGNVSKESIEPLMITNLHKLYLELCLKIIILENKSMNFLCCFSANRIGRRMDELISEFSPSKITTHSALLDLEKLPDFNRWVTNTPAFFMYFRFCFFCCFRPVWYKSFLLLSFQKPISVFVMHYSGLVSTLAVLQSVLSTSVSSSVSCWPMFHHVVLNAVFRWDVMTHGSSVKGLYQSVLPWISQLNGCCFIHISYQPSLVWLWPDAITVQDVKVIFFLTKDGNVIIH